MAIDLLHNLDTVKTDGEVLYLSCSGGVRVPIGTTAQRRSDPGVIRYNSDTNKIELTEDGIEFLTLGTRPLETFLFKQGAENNLSWAFQGDTDTGMFRSAANSISLVLGGSTRAVYSPSGFTQNVGQTFSGGLHVSGGGTTLDGNVTITGNATVPNGGSFTAASGAQVLLNYSPSAANHAVNKQYVDSISQGLTPKQTARLATDGPLPSNTYSNGASGVGATITSTINGLLAVDGIYASLNDIILVKNEVSQIKNGLYKVTNTGSVSTPFVLTRTDDMNVSSEFSGAFVPVASEGYTNNNSLWMCNPTGTVTVGSTAITFTQLNGATALLPGNGILISGNTVSVNRTIDLEIIQSSTALALKSATGYSFTLGVDGGLGGNYTAAGFTSYIAPNFNSGGVAFLLGAGTWAGDSPANIDVTASTGITTVGGSGSQLFTFSSASGQLSVQIDGSLFLGTGLSYNPLSVVPDAVGFLASSGGASFQTTVYAGAGFVANNGQFGSAAATKLDLNIDGGILIKNNAANMAVLLQMEANNTLAMRNGAHGQVLNLYNNYIDGSNYERGMMGWVFDTFYIGTQNAGVGTPRGVGFTANGQTRFYLNSNGYPYIINNTPLYWLTTGSTLTNMLHLDNSNVWNMGANGLATVIKGSAFYFNTSNGTQFVVNDSLGTAANYWVTYGSATGGSAALTATGSDTNVNGNIGTKGDGWLNFFTGTNHQLSITNTTGSVNRWQFTGATTGNAVIGYAGGSDTNTNMAFGVQGAGSIGFFTGQGNQFSIQSTASSISYWSATGAALNNAPSLYVVSSSSNVDGLISAKGTGIIVFGGTNGIRFPHGTTGQRRGSPSYDFRFNSSHGTWEGHNGTLWQIFDRMWSPLEIQNGNYNITSDDQGKTIIGDPTSAGGNYTYNLPSAAAVGNGFTINVKHAGTDNSIIVNRAGSDDVEGSTSLVVTWGNAFRLISNGSTSWRVTSWVATPIGGGGSGTVTAIGISGGTTGLGASGSPVTTSGTISLTLTNYLRFNNDTTLARMGANILAMVNSTTAQEFRIYNTYTDGSNYEYFYAGFSGNNMVLNTAAAGTGTQRTITILSTLGISGNPVASTTSGLWLYSDVTFGTQPHTIGFNLYYKGAWRYTANGSGGFLRSDSSYPIQLGTAAVNSSGAGAAASINFAMVIDSGNRIGFHSNPHASYPHYFVGDILQNGWFRIATTTGIYWESYGGGWNMTDSTFLKVYGGKALYSFMAGDEAYVTERATHNWLYHSFWINGARVGLVGYDGGGMALYSDTAYAGIYVGGSRRWYIAAAEAGYYAAAEAYLKATAGGSNNSATLQLYNTGAANKRISEIFSVGDGSSVIFRNCNDAYNADDIWIMMNRQTSTYLVDWVDVRARGYTHAVGRQIGGVYWASMATANLNDSVRAGVYNPNTGASAGAEHILHAGGRIASRYLSYTGQYIHEYGQGGIATKYSDFDTHKFRDSAGNARIALTSGLYLYVVTYSNTEYVTTNNIGFRINVGAVGSMFYNDGINTYFLISTASGGNGTWNSLRPIQWNNSNGNVTLGHTLYARGAIWSSVSGAPVFQTDGTAGTYRYIRWSSSGLGVRWDLGINDSAEGGGDTGGNFYLTRWNDAQTVAPMTMYIRRDNGYWSVGPHVITPTRAFEIGGNLDGAHEVRIFNASSGTRANSTILLDITTVANGYWTHSITRNGGNPYLYTEVGGGVTGPWYINTCDILIRARNDTLLFSIAEASGAVNIYARNNGRDALLIHAASPSSKFITFKAETSSDIAQMFYWNGSAAVTLQLVGTISILGRLVCAGFSTGSDNGSTVTFDSSFNNYYYHNLAGNRTFALTTTPAPGTYTFWLGTGAGYSWTWPGGWRWAGGSAPTQTTTASKINVLTLQSDGSTILAALSNGH